VKRSLVAAAGGLFRLPRALPKHIAMELALTGDPIDAQRAYELGFVNRLSEPDKLIETATALADQICANAPLAVRASRQIVLDGMLAADDDAWRITNEAFAAVASSEDFGEGPRAFIEKREPQWKGR
jgi:enoyl-CoA hydratase